jgi:hypothetical protein
MSRKRFLTATSSEKEISERKVAFATLAIPLIGPFVSAAAFPQEESGQRTAKQLEQALTWSMTWAFIDGGAQIAGLAMTVAGARKRPVGGRHHAVQVVPWGLPLGSGIMAMGQF